MAKKVLFSLILLWVSGHFLLIPTLQAKPVTNISPCDCNLEPPTSLHATKVGTTTADIAWNPVTGAGGYRVKVYQKVGNNYVFLYEINHFSTTMTVTGLIPGSEHRVTVAGMCWCNSAEGNWLVSPKESTLELPKVILDLDIIQVAPMPPNASLITCVSPTAGCCYSFNYINGNRLWIKVKKGDNCNIHPIRITDGGKATLFKRTDQSSQCPKTLYTQNAGYLGSTLIYQPNIGLSYAVIREEEGSDILRIYAYTNGSDAVNEICITNILTGYTCEVYEVNTFGFGPPNGGDRNELPTSSTPTTYPISPFAENLDIVDASPGDLPVKLQLFDLSGRLQTTQHYGSGQDAYSMPTAELPPGLYILRVESGGATQTNKVVKTQN